MKIVFPFFIFLFFWSCQSVKSEAEREHDLEMLDWANQNLALEIEDLKGQLHGALLALTTTGSADSIQKSAHKKTEQIDSLFESELEFVKTLKQHSSITKIGDKINAKIIQIIGSDTSFVIHFHGKDYIDSTKTYLYNDLLNDLESFKTETSILIDGVTKPTPLELREIKTLVTSQLLIIEKKTLTYLSQYIQTRRHYNIDDKVSLALQIDKVKYKPNETMTFSVLPSVDFITNFNLLHYTIDDSIQKEIYRVNQYSIDSIILPTNHIGQHKLEVWQYLGHDNNYIHETYYYEVIE
ncbi:MAG: hypothetical protein ACWA41_06105 [Putridiphycobacter sp.]